jgi:hypothetical protein
MFRNELDKEITRYYGVSEKKYGDYRNIMSQALAESLEISNKTGHPLIYSRDLYKAVQAPHTDSKENEIKKSTWTLPYYARFQDEIKRGPYRVPTFVTSNKDMKKLHDWAVEKWPDKRNRPAYITRHPTFWLQFGIQRARELIDEKVREDKENKQVRMKGKKFVAKN